MDLLERYLAALRALLPRKTAADILREIADELESQMEDKAEQLGRPLTEDEQADVIRRLGHPAVVAARYGEPRYLIGPQLFPFYWRTLKIGFIGAVVIAILVGFAGLPAAEDRSDWTALLLRIPATLVFVFGITTAVFAGLEFSRRFVKCRTASHWDPRTLPSPARHSAKRTQSVAEILFSAAGLLWWNSLRSMPFLALGPAAAFLKLGPAWDVLHWPVLILIAANICKAILYLLRPERAVLHATVALLLDAAELALLVVALRAGEWVVVEPALAGAGHYAAAAGLLNRVLGTGCFIGLLIRAVQFVFKCIRYRRESMSKSGLRTVSAI
jgi:hypothetical protein